MKTASFKSMGGTMRSPKKILRKVSDGIMDFNDEELRDLFKQLIECSLEEDDELMWERE